MPGTRQVPIAFQQRQRSFAEVEPILYEDGDSVTLQFKIGAIQSEMLDSDPDFLVLSYTRTMMAFMLFNSEPKRIAVIGLGGGSMTKWCYRQLPTADITAIEINPKVVALRDRFYLPVDNDRFRVVCRDGADYVAQTSESLEVLLVDGFDLYGQPPQLCAGQFYDNCYRALAPDGLLVVNLCGLEDGRLIERIRRSFDDRALVIMPEDGENKIVFAIKGDRLWTRDEPISELVDRLRSWYPPYLINA